MISVIIPVYNSQDYLASCIRSILKQTYQNFEIIIVDDGSTDNSVKICKEFSKNDNRIKLYTKRNEGQSTARNLGLDQASGDYISFIDSDDEISSDVFTNAIKIFAKNTSTEVIQFPVYMNYGLETQYLTIKKEQIITGKENLFKQWLSENNISWIVCNKIFRKSVFESLRFETIYYEDNYMVADVLSKIYTLQITEIGIYYYHHRANSTTTSIQSLEKERDTQKVNFRIYKALHQFENSKGTKIILQEKILNVGLSLYRNYNQELLLFPKEEILLIPVLVSKISFKQKVKLFLYRVFGQAILKI